MTSNNHARSTLDVFVPQIALADRLDGWVDELVSWLHDQPTEQDRTTYIDLMVGLSTGAEAMRAFARGDLSACVDHMHSAVRHLESVHELDIVVPDGPAGPDSP
jgi:hypothetical protein